MVYSIDISLFVVMQLFTRSRAWREVYVMF